jgi:hypothetical protein
MVQYFEENDTAGPPLDILQAIFYISEAWRELSNSIVLNCGSTPVLLKHRTGIDFCPMVHMYVCT